MSVESTFRDADDVDAEDSEPMRMMPGQGPILPAIFSTEPKYVEWISEWRKTHSQRNACYSASHKIAEKFPELKICRGWAHFKIDLS